MINMPIHQTIDNSSKFHWLFTKADLAARPRHDQPICETANFVVLPSLGSIVPGWLLIVPKLPVSRMADIVPSSHGVLVELVELMTQAVEDRFGSAYYFEHGGHKGSLISCGVDQAHLHIVPLPFDLVERATQVEPCTWNKLGNSALPIDVVTDDEYWFVSSGETSHYRVVTDPKSQWFRKLIANEMGQPEAWNYKQYDFPEHIEETLSAMDAHG